MQRNHFDIIYNILNEIKYQPKLKTHIMYEANLNHYQLTKYLLLLTKSQLIRKAFDDKFMITEKGLSFIKLYQQLVKLTQEIIITDKIGDIIG